jgi:pSer/pThr/pTyr-binding forkhead associated (FHA) protein
MSDQSLNLFREACGASGPWHLSAEGPDRHGTVLEAFHAPFAVIGRDPKADLVLSDEQVSRRHAYLQVVGGRLFCVDLQSRTGTHWEAGPGQAGWLGHARDLRIGPYVIRPADGAYDAQDWSAFQPLAPRSPGSHDLPEVTLEFVDGAARRTTWRMNRVLALVGRSKSCKVKLYHASVSSIHCSLLHTPSGVWVIDLLGRDGISVNGTGSRWSRLDEGDELQVGTFLIRVHYDTPPGPGMRGGHAVAAVVHPLPGLDEPVPPPAEASPPPADVGRALVPSHRGPLLPAGHPANSTESLLVPLVNQFALMQQQMFDQFQQTVMMMVQMFGAMHKEQMGFIREEMDRVQELTRELHALQAELAKRPQEGPAQAAAQGLAAPVPVSAAPPAGPTDLSHAGIPVPPAATGPPRGSAVNGDHAAPAAPSHAAGDLAASQPVAVPSANHNIPVSSEQPAADGPPPGTARETDIHIWLHQRIAEIQRERQSRFQRILNYVLGQ